MFWNFEEWSNAFLIQFISILIAFVIGRKNKVKDKDIFLAISMVSPVALFNASAGVAGAIFLSDLVVIYLLFWDRSVLQKTKVVVFAFFLYLAWPILSTLFAVIYAPNSSEIVGFETKILVIQFFRYLLFFTLLAKLVSNPYTDAAYILKLFKIQSVMIFFVFTSILLGYLGIIKVDAWNELIGEYFFGNNLGKGGMYLYRGGVGTLSTISIPVLYYCFFMSKGWYKYLMGFLIFIVLAAVLFSGSRQGISISLLSLLLSMFLFKQYKKAIQIVIIGSVLMFFALQNNAIRQTSEWVLNRYNILLSDKVDLSDEVKDRNFALDIAKKRDKDFFYEVNGYGLGGQISGTESDYYNNYSYFGVIGSIFYFLFITYCTIKIYINWKITNDKIMKNIYLISLIAAITLPLYGFQQWYIMTFGSINAMNIYYILFIFSFALRNSKTVNNKFRILKD